MGAHKHLVADHFLKQGYRRFDVLVARHADAQRQRKNGFSAALAKSGMSAEEFIWSSSLTDEVRDHLSVWLKKLPKPCALFCTADSLGRGGFGGLS